MGTLPMLLMFVVLLGMWFFMSRTQKKQQQERQNLLEAMKKGDNVVTIGGLHGVIFEINEDKRTVVLDCEGIYLEFDRASIKTVQPGAAATVEPVAPAQPAEPAETPVEPTPAEPDEKDTDSEEK